MTKRLGAVLLLGLSVLVGCSELDSQGSGLPTLPPTLTALPPSTPTDVPIPDPVNLPSVDWEDIEKFRAAMRPAFANDIDDFVNHNRYYIEASLVFENGVLILHGAERVRYTNRSEDDLNEIVFRLYPNLPAFGGRMNVFRTTLNGEAFEPNLTERNSALVFPLATPLEPGESAEMTLEWTLTAEKGIMGGYGEYGYQHDVFSGPEWYPMLSVYDEETGWWVDRPTSMGDAVYSETGLYEVLLTTPEDFVVVMSGSEIESFAASNDMTTHHYVSGPMRDSLLVTGPSLGKLTEQVEDITLNVYYWPGDEVAAEEVMKISLDSMRIFNEQFGPYPYAEFDVAETFNLSGIEYPGIVIIAQRNWLPGNNFLEVTTAHEIAHQWWYSLVGNDQVHQPWLDESLTSYSEYVYHLGVYGEKRVKEVIEGDRDYYNYYRGTGAADLVLNLPVSAYTDSNYGMIIYTKGPLFYVELEEMLGRETFMKALQTYFERYRYQVVRSADILNTFEEVSGQQLDEVFYQWVGNFPGLDQKVVEEMEARQNQQTQ